MGTTGQHPAGSETFCVLPWIHLQLNTSGEINACCLASRPYGNINENTIKEIWHGNEIRELREKLLGNVKDERCSNCYAKEAAGGTSLRQHSNHHFYNIIPQVVENSGFNFPLYLDIRFSNVCNFRCRTCYHGASSRWFEEALKLGETVSDKPIIRAIDDLDNFYDQIETSIDCVEQIYFAGGEPLVMEEHYKILEILQNSNGYNKYLRYNTNFSKVNYKETNVFNIWSKFKNVYVAASLDGSGERGEFLRKEQQWKEVLRNRQVMKQVCPNVEFVVSTTVSVFNVFHIPDFHKELVSSDFIDIEGFLVDNLLQTPGFYNIQILPMEFKLKVKQKFEEHIDWIKAYVERNPDICLKKDSRLISQFENCINYLFACDLSERIPSFISRCNQLDKLRSERTHEIFPELEFLFKPVYN